jgi:hemerythrin-like metal-binding protein
MPIVEWRDINSVNVKGLDRDHQKMARMLERLSRKKDLKSVKQILKKLIAYTARHFKAEEDYFEKYGFPLKSAHIRQHKYFTKRVLEFERQCAQGQPIVGELMDFLSGWWINHINHSDQKYSTFLNKKGVY